MKKGELWKWLEFRRYPDTELTSKYYILVMSSRRLGSDKYVIQVFFSLPSTQKAW